VVKRLVLFFLLASCIHPQDFSHIKVIEVIDGDTVRLERGNILRYIGVDTPEVRVKRGGEWVWQPQPYALEALRFNKQLVEGKYIRVEFDVERRDDYGRLLGYVFLDDTFVNAKLLEEGYAVLYTYPPNVKYVDLFVRLQEQARKKRKGMWGVYEVVSADNAHRFIGQIRTVRGRVLSTHRSKKCIFFNFGPDFQTDFTVVIFKNAWKYFEDKGIDPIVFYKDKLIEVSGRIREYNGPEIIVNSPEEIVVLSTN
jgi:micrococcal nuclease